MMQVFLTSLVTLLTGELILSDETMLINILSDSSDDELFLRVFTTNDGVGLFILSLHYH